jgi:hypothetical protein
MNVSDFWGIGQCQLITIHFTSLNSSILGLAILQWAKILGLQRHLNSRILPIIKTHDSNLSKRTDSFLHQESGRRLDEPVDSFKKWFLALAEPVDARLIEIAIRRHLNALPIVPIAPVAEIDAVHVKLELAGLSPFTEACRAEHSQFHASLLAITRTFTCYQE